jgi:hypothetical protein
LLWHHPTTLLLLVGVAGHAGMLLRAARIGARLHLGTRLGIARHPTSWLTRIAGGNVLLGAARRVAGIPAGLSATVTLHRTVSRRSPSGIVTRVGSRHTSTGRIGARLAIHSGTTTSHLHLLGPSAYHARLAGGIARIAGCRTTHHSLSSAAATAATWIAAACPSARVGGIPWRTGATRWPATVAAVL